MYTSRLVFALLAAPLLFACSDPPPVTVPDACTPATCESAHKNCGQLSDGCGGTLECGSCPTPKTCGGGGTPNVCGVVLCVPKSCPNGGCGSMPDGCGLAIQCGTCPQGQTCGGEGTANVCGTGTCTAKSCVDLGRVCGQASDGCGTALECGTCTAPAVCDTDGHCGCEPETKEEFCVRLRRDCETFTAPDNCGVERTEDCGTCTLPKTCGGNGAPNVCGCRPASCPAGVCGSIDDGCGGTTLCAPCTAPGSCNANGQCACQQATCPAGACGEVYDGCGLMLDCGTCAAGQTPEPVRLRVISANLTSGNLQSWDPGEGTRILQGLKPDVVIIQEFNYRAGSHRDFVSQNFGAGFYHSVESNAQIPNGVISRYPIVESGEWDDTLAPNRDFAWARIDIPGPKDLWVVSMHLLTGSTGERNDEAQALVAKIQANVPAGDLLVIGGDLNTGSRTESCIKTFAQVVVTSSPWPEDQSGNDGTNASRGKPLDWVMPDADLKSFQVPVVIGSDSFSSGLVFDSRVYRPLSDVPPVLKADSDAPNMQHMAVVREFLVRQ